MKKVIAGMSISLDGFVNDANGSVEKLFPDFQELHAVSSFQKMIEDTGAVIMGRNTYEMANPFEWATDDYEFQTPIIVLTHNPPTKYPQGNGKLKFYFTTEGIESAIQQAIELANGRDVQVIGANTIQQCLNAGLCDELQIDFIPVLLGSGLSLFKNIEVESLRLKQERVEEATSMRTSITYSVSKTN